MLPVVRPPRARGHSTYALRRRPLRVDGTITRSKLERAFARLESEHGIGPGWVAQFQPPWYDGIRDVVDNALPEAKLMVETDGRRWHRCDENLREDRRRDRVAALHGWQVARYGYEEVVERPAEVAAEIRELRTIRLAA